jgi:hypothetical protein
MTFLAGPEVWYEFIHSSALWKDMKNLISERIEDLRDILELPSALREQQMSDDLIRGAISELRTFITTIEDDSLLLAEIREQFNDIES